MIFVTLADDHQLFADSLSMGLDLIPDISILDTVADGSALLAALDERIPDVVVMDLEMPVLDGYGVLASDIGLPPVIVVTMHATEAERKKVLASGAAAFLPKSTPLEDLAGAIRAVHAGTDLADPTTFRGNLDAHLSPILDPGAASLTNRERELLVQLARGITGTPEIAQRLYISEKTVKNHLASIYVKLDVVDRAQAAVEAIRLGFGAK